jgi:polyisoprenoid-binding protein YceI
MPMRRALTALVLTLAACATPVAVPAPTPTPEHAASAGSSVPAALASAEGTSFDPAAAPAGAYALDPRHASVIWRVRHMGLSIYQGRVDACRRSTSSCQDAAITSTITFNPQTPEQSALNVSIGLNAISTGLVNMQGERAFDGEIANVLGAERQAQATFVSRSVTRTGPTTGLVTGDLSLNGQTHPVTLETTFQGGKSVALRGGKYVLAFSARTIIQRSQWGVGSVIFNQFAGDDVEILFEGEFVQQ